MGKPESIVEHYLVREAEALGATVRKIQYIGRRGCPDRAVFYKGVTVLCECKRVGDQLDAHQRREFKLLEKQGIPVYVLASMDDVDDMLDLLAEVV